MATQPQENTAHNGVFLLKMLTMILVIGLAVLGILLGVRYAAPVVTTLLRKANLVPASALTGIDGDGDIERQIRTTAAGLDADSGDIAVRSADQGSIRELRIRIPRGRPIEYVVLAMSQAARGTPYRVEDCIHSQKKQSCVITYSSADANLPGVRLVLSQPDRFAGGTGRMALLISDFSTIADQTTIDLLSFSEPFTVAMTAGPNVSEWTSQIADHYKKEVAILLPMEPAVLAPSRRSESMIMVHYDEARVKGILSRAVGAIPRFSGFCSLMGSRVLEDSRMTTIVLSDIKKQRGYFIDTREERSQRAAGIARALGVPCIAPDAVIPRGAREATVDSLLVAFTTAVQKRGTLLVRGSCTPALALVLHKRQAWFRQNGVSLVYVSQLLNGKTTSGD